MRNMRRYKDVKIWKIIYQIMRTLFKEVEIEFKWQLFKNLRRGRVGKEGNLFNISITTQWFRRRILVKTLKSIIIQKKPRTVIYIFVNLKEQEKFEEILKKFYIYGVCVISMTPDYKVFNKVFGPIQEEIINNILIIDDDTYYPNDFLKSFENVDIKNRTIYGTRGAIYKKHQKYNEYANVENGSEATVNVILTGKGGILLSEDARNEIAKSKGFTTISPKNDDLWYFFFLREIGYKFEVIKMKNNTFIDWFGESKGSLRRQNIDKGENDILIAQIKQYFESKNQI
jgi:hypothetical protein